MTPQEINVAVAEEMGWKKKREIEPGEWVWLRPNGEVVGQSCMPDFHGSLDCAAEMEKALTIEERERFAVFLDIRCGDDYHEGRKHWSARPTHATAPQRCEAFLRVRSKWPTA